MTLHSLGKLTSISRGALTGVTVVGGLLNRHVIGHYGEALRTLREKGFYETVRDSYAPYVEAVWNNFAAQRDTWTAGIVTGRYFTSAFQSVRSWLFSATPPPSKHAASVVRTLAIGDIHGFWGALAALAQAVPFTDDDLIVTLGDHVDRGPESRAVLDWLLERSGAGRLLALRGNHEEVMLQARRDPDRLKAWAGFRR